MRFRFTGWAGWLAVAGMLCWALVWLVRQERFAWAMHRGNYQAAVRIWPAQESGWLALTDAQKEQLNFRLAEASAAHAAALVPNDWVAWSDLAGLQWQLDQPRQAQSSMARMAAVSRTYSARWQYANLLLISNQVEGFWRESVNALTLAKDFEVERTLDQCANVAGDAHRMRLVGVVSEAAARAPNASQRSLLSATLLSYAADRQWWDVAAGAWRQLLGQSRGSGTLALAPAARDYLLALVVGGQRAQARELWQATQAQKILPAGEGPSASNAVTDGGFEHLDSGSPLGWLPCSDCGPRVYSTALDSPAGAGGRSYARALNMDFDGSEPQDVQLARQRLLLLPSTQYQLQALGGSQGGAPGTGVSLRVLLGPTVCAQLDLPATSGLHTMVAGFVTGKDADAAYDLQLVYQRPFGQSLLQGTVQLTGVSLRPAAGDATAAVCQETSAP